VAEHASGGAAPEGCAVTIRSPHPSDGLVAFVMTVVLGCAIAVVVASFLLRSR
jgi:hypothetical protein